MRPSPHACGFHPFSRSSAATPKSAACKLPRAAIPPPSGTGILADVEYEAASEPVATVGAFLAGLLFVLAPSAPASGQQPGGVLRMSHFDSPASMSMHEESTAAVNRPMMGVFNNLIMYRQDAPQNTSETIMPDLATGWS